MEIFVLNLGKKTTEKLVQEILLNGKIQHVKVLLIYLKAHQRIYVNVVQKKFPSLIYNLQDSILTVVVLMFLVNSKATKLFVETEPY